MPRGERPAVAEAWADKYHDGIWSRVEMVSAVRDNASFEVIPRRAFGVIETPELFSSAATR